MTAVIICSKLLKKTLNYIVEMNGAAYATNHEKKLRSLASTLYEWETSSRCRDDFVAVTEDIDVAMKLAEAVIAYADSLCVKIELKDMNLEN